MKKLLAMILAFALILALAACGETEDPADDVTLSEQSEPKELEEASPSPDVTEGDPSPSAENDGGEETQDTAPAVTPETWYGLTRGLELTLALSPDGTYTLAVGEETKSGAWELKDGLIALDGEEEGSLFKVNGLLSWPAMGLYLTPEKPEFGAYVPADVVTDGITGETFNGYWQSAFVDAEGVILSAADLDDKTDVYVDSVILSEQSESKDLSTPAQSASAQDDMVKVALGGPLFGDVAVDMTFSDGALTWEEGDVSVTLRLQADGLLRMTLRAPDSDLTLYLMPVYVEGLRPAPAEG